MLFKEAVSKRIFFFFRKYNITPNKLAELSTIPPTTLSSTLANRVDNPSSTNIYKICKTLKITLKDFYDSELFNFDNLDD